MWPNISPFSLEPEWFLDAIFCDNLDDEIINYWAKMWDRLSKMVLVKIFWVGRKKASVRALALDNLTKEKKQHVRTHKIKILKSTTHSGCAQLGEMKAYLRELTKRSEDFWVQESHQESRTFHLVLWMFILEAAWLDQNWGAIRQDELRKATPEVT